MTADPTFYDVLGIPPESDQEDIKRAFRLRALETHPDRNPGDPGAHMAFIRVAQAYETLSDIHRRAAYDFRTLKTRSKTAEYGVTVDDVLESDHESILDSKADDALEEYIVGNTPPRNTTLGTFFRDLERTEIFILFRDGKEAFVRGRFARAAEILARAVEKSPHNILYRYYHGLALAEIGRTRQAVRELKCAIRLGEWRYPARLCPGVRRALYDLYVRKGKRLRAWWMARQQGLILFAERMTLAQRDQLRLKKMAYVEGLKQAGEIGKAPLPLLPESTREP